MIIGNTYIYKNSTYTIHGYYSGVWGWSVGNQANNLNRYSSLNKNNSIPSGYTPNYTWAPAIKANGLAVLDYGSGTVYKALMANAINLGNSTYALVGQGSVVSANLQNLVKMLATVTGTGSVNKAQMASILKMLATNISGSGTVTKANMGAIIGMLATAQGTGSVNYANILGKAYMSAHIYVNESAATTEQLVDAIWDELVANHNTPGSTGEALADAGGAGNPWSSSTATNNNPGTFGEMVQDIKKTGIGSQGLILGA